MAQQRRLERNEYANDLYADLRWNGEVHVRHILRSILCACRFPISVEIGNIGIGNTSTMATLNKIFVRAVAGAAIYEMDTVWSD